MGKRGELQSECILGYIFPRESAIISVLCVGRWIAFFV